MGLDSYLFRKKVGDTQFELPHPLVGGMFSGHGCDGSFRGKVYDSFVEAVTGKSLYVEEAGPYYVRDIAEGLQRFLDGNPPDSVFEMHGISREEAVALAALFHQAADKGCSYIGWW